MRVWQDIFEKTEAVVLLQFLNFPVNGEGFALVYDPKRLRYGFTWGSAWPLDGFVPAEDVCDADEENGIKWYETEAEAQRALEQAIVSLFQPSREAQDEDEGGKDVTNMAEEYNGWPNRETWAAHLWLTNDENTYKYWYERGQELDKYALGDELKAHFEELWRDLMENKTAESTVLSMLNDIGSLWRVDWVRVAEALQE